MPDCMKAHARLSLTHHARDGVGFSMVAPGNHTSLNKVMTRDVLLLLYTLSEFTAVSLSIQKTAMLGGGMA